MLRNKKVEIPKVTARNNSANLKTKHAIPSTIGNSKGRVRMKRQTDPGQLSKFFSRRILYKFEFT